MNFRFAALPALALPLVFAVACDRQPAAPQPAASATNHLPLMQQTKKGTGLVLNSLTGTPLLGDVTINQVELTHFAIVEDVVGQIVGVQVDGVLQLTGGVFGADIVSEDFSTTLSAASSGFGQCGVVTLDLAPFDVNLLLAQVDLPAARVDVQGSGALGPVLCALGQLLTPVTQGVRGIVQALNHLI